SWTRSSTTTFARWRRSSSSSESPTRRCASARRCGCCWSPRASERRSGASLLLVCVLRPLLLPPGPLTPRADAAPAVGPAAVAAGVVAAGADQQAGERRRPAVRAALARHELHLASLPGRP